MPKNIDPARVAAALCRGELPNREVAGVLFKEAKLTSPISMPTPPDIESVRIVSTKNWVKAATALESRVPEMLGAEGAEHKSIKVKRSYILNGTDKKAIQDLENLAMQDGETARAWAEVVGAEHMLKSIGEGAQYREEAYVTLGRILVKSGRACEKVLQSIKPLEARENTIVGVLAECILRGETVRGRKSVGLIPKGRRDHVVSLAFDEALEDWSQGKEPREGAGGEVIETIEKMFGKVGTRKLLDNLSPMARLGRGFIGAFFEKHPQEAWGYFEAYAKTETYAEALGEIGTAETLSLLISMKAPEIEKHAGAIESCLKKAAKSGDMVPWGDGSSMVGEFLRDWKTTLEDDDMLYLLRNGEESTTISWLLGEYANKPKLGMVPKLVKNPGTAFDGRKTPSMFLLRRIVTNLEHLAKAPWIDEAFEALGPDATDVLLGAATENGGGWWDYDYEAVCSYLTRRFTEVLGGEPETWRLALPLVAKSSQPLGRTLRAAAALSR